MPFVVARAFVVKAYYSLHGDADRQLEVVAVA